jgi:hypothetical protein
MPPTLGRRSAKVPMARCRPRPWLGWVILLEDCDGSARWWRWPSHTSACSQHAAAIEVDIHPPERREPRRSLLQCERGKPKHVSGSLYRLAVEVGSAVRGS